MKKIVFSCLICLLSFLLLMPKALASDEGTLKINTDIPSDNRSKELNYIEQENDLSLLFRDDTTANIQRKQEITKLDEQDDKKRLFLKTSDSESFISNYTSILFTPNSKVKSTDTHHIAMTARTAQLSWHMVMVLIIAGVMMLYSIFKVTKQKKGYDRR